MEGEPIRSVDLTVKAQAGPAPDETYTIRRLGPEDALGVARAAYAAYGYSYPSAHLYEPRQLAERNESGALISAVAVRDRTGEVVGHSSLQPYGTRWHAESGQTVVSPAHRGRGLTDRLLAFVDGEARKAGLPCLVCHEVTSHPAMQLVSGRSGYRPCGLALGAMPQTLDFRGIAGARVQRESCTVSMKFLSAPEPAVVCPPSHHREMVEQIYASLGRPVSFESLPEPSGPGSVAVWVNEAWGLGDIHVQRVGTETRTEVRRCLQDLLHTAKMPVVYLALPLDQGGTDGLARTAEAEGFFFVGLGPSSATRGEALYFQYLDTELDMSRICVATPMGRTIFDYVARERQRVSTLKGRLP